MVPVTTTGKVGSVAAHLMAANALTVAGLADGEGDYVTDGAPPHPRPTGRLHRAVRVDRAEAFW
jgi:hypothetical protein